MKEMLIKKQQKTQDFLNKILGYMNHGSKSCLKI